MRNVQAAMGKTLIVIVFLSFACAVGNVPNGSARGRLGFDPANFDPSIRACDDFYGYANGQWLATHPVPLNEAVWGMASTAIAGNERTLRQILEDLSTGPDLSPDDQKLGDFYASCMDTKSIDAGGLTPIRADLDRIDHIGTERDLTDLFARLASYGISQPFAFRATKDPSDSRRVFAEVAQGELVLSEPNDYLAEMDEARALRTQYEHHVAAMLHLAGLNGQAAAVVLIQTA